MVDNNIIQVKKIGVSFGKTSVLRHLSLEIKQGEIIGIAGASGSGKSTLLNALAGLIEPDEGEVIYSLDAKEFEFIQNRKYLKNFIGYSLQYPCFYEELSVNENLDYFSSLFGISRRLRKEIILTVLKMVELEMFKTKRAGSLSGGMKRRLDIALALVHNPKILFLDEPTSDLDPILREKIWSLIHKIKENGTTVIISSHFLSELEENCERIALLNNGKIARILTSSNKELLNEEWIQLCTRERKYSEIIHELNTEEQDIIAVMEKGDFLIIKTQNSEKVLSNILKIIKKHKFEIESIERITPSVEDIFKDTLGK